MFMNSLSDILNQKADELFIGDLPPLDSTGDDKQVISIPPVEPACRQAVVRWGLNLSSYI